MRFKVIACKVLEREIALIMAKSEHFIDTTFLRQGLHNEPDKLRRVLQAEIDRIDSGECLYTCAEDESNGLFDAIVLGYGLCSNGILGLHSSKHRLVVPRAHDCITLFLGSKESYKSYFDSKDGGIYWYTPGWIENTIMPSKARYDLIYNRYAEQYGEDNAEFLMEMEQGWMKEYKMCTYVHWDELPFPKHIEYTRQCAEYLGWQHEILKGEPTLFNDLLSGNWRDDAFIVVEPGQKVGASYDDLVLRVDNADIEC